MFLFLLLLGSQVSSADKIVVIDNSLQTHPLMPYFEYIRNTDKEIPPEEIQNHFDKFIPLNGISDTEYKVIPWLKFTAYNSLDYPTSIFVSGADFWQNTQFDLFKRVNGQLIRQKLLFSHGKRTFQIHLPKKSQAEYYIRTSNRYHVDVKYQLLSFQSWIDNSIVFL